MFDNIPDELINCAWTKRSDIAGLYASNGWATGTVADKRRALNDWWSWTPEDKRGLAPLAWCQAICGVTATPPPTGSTGGTRSPSTDGIILQPYIDWAKANPIPAAIIGLVVLKILR